MNAKKRLQSPSFSVRMWAPPPTVFKVKMDRGRWLDPRGADSPVAKWAKEFLSLAQRLSPTPEKTTLLVGQTRR